MNILQQIFTDYYEEMKYTLHPRKTEMENIDKMLNCGNPSFGGAMFGCPHCGKLKQPLLSYLRKQVYHETHYHYVLQAGQRCASPLCLYH